MRHAERVREYCRTQLIEPARASGAATVSIRAGDVHAALGFKNRLPLVCSAIGANVFEHFANVERVSINGPSNGANAVFTFKIK